MVCCLGCRCCCCVLSQKNLVLKHHYILTQIFELGIKNMILQKAGVGGEEERNKKVRRKTNKIF